MRRRPPCWSLSTKRIRLVVAYDGSGFCGWAAQRGQRTVHGTLTEAVRRISGEDCEIIGASRTDSGAHAKGQVCHFDVGVPIPVEKWCSILNHVLPADVAVISSAEAHPEFNSRFWAKDRWYRYRILSGPRDPRRSRYVFQSERELDVELMGESAQKLVGMHDFLGFSVGWRISRRRGKGYPHVEPSKRAEGRIKKRLTELTARRRTLLPMPRLIGEVNQVLRGWSGYFHHRNCSTVFGRVKSHAEERLRTHLRRRHKLHSRAQGYIRFPTAYLYDHLGLFKLPTGAGWKSAHALA